MQLWWLRLKCFMGSFLHGCFILIAQYRQRASLSERVCLQVCFIPLVAQLGFCVELLLTAQLNSQLQTHLFP
jgi:hypothetical protein